jgi:hypothetical protein
MLAITADGRKLPPNMLFKRMTVAKAKLLNGVPVHVLGKVGWCVIGSAQFWGQRPGALLQQLSLLVYDSFRGHLGDDEDEMKTDLTVIPGGLSVL